MSDGEGAISKLRTHLNSLGMEVDISGAGGHVPQIERRIGITKVDIAMLVLICVITCPRELFCGRRVDGTLYFRAVFGDYVQAIVPNKNNTTEARTEDCIVMLPLRNLTGSVTCRIHEIGQHAANTTRPTHHPTDNSICNQAIKRQCT